MTASEKTISSILKDLANIHENLLSLSDDIWNSIDHNDCKEEHEIDLRIYHLYGLSFEEAKVIDGSLTEEEFNSVKV